MGRLTTRNFENETCCAVGGCIAYEDCYECPGFQDILAKLAHYEDLEEAGRLVEMPFDVGDTAWILLTDEHRIVEVEIEQVVIGKTLDVILLEGDMQFTIWDKDWEVVRRFFFASREEAEAALKGENHD